jgi:hypothetical protein
LKHLWCHQLLPENAEPPACPVDRLMLNKVRPRHGINWTQIATMADYDTAFGYIADAATACTMTPAAYELFTFSGQPVRLDAESLRDAEAWFLNHNKFAAKPNASKGEIWAGALKDALRSAHNRAGLYRKNPELARGPFLVALRQELRMRGAGYVTTTTPLTMTQFQKDIRQIAEKMATAFQGLF